jgi:Glycoside hydrolase 123, catalytic domain/Glycoside hydrolase 123 N-terminal domain
MAARTRLARRAFLLAAAIGLLVLSPIPARTDRPRYGHLVQSTPPCAVWWAEGAHKVMRDDPLPAAKDGVVRIAAARNEYEPFLIVLRPEDSLDGVRVSAGPLVNEKGAAIEAAAVSVRHVEYVKVTAPTDTGGRAGWWPDPLPPYDGPFAAAAGENHPLWMTVRVPKDAAPGLYKGALALTAEGWSCRVPVELRVRGFTLPDKASVRSSFGLPAGDIKAYHNLETREELEQVVDLYYQNMREHRLAPTSPFELYPMKVETNGVLWRGGEFVTEGVHGGRRALKVVDDTTEENVAAAYEPVISVAGHTPLDLTFWARTAEAGQPYTVLCEFFAPEGAWIAGANLLRVFEGAKDWKMEKVEFPRPPDEAAGLRLSLFPAFRDNAGSTKGTAWFDDIILRAAPKGPEARIDSLLPGGDFEMPLEKMSVSVDFTEFDRGARRFLDELGFNAYNLHLEGLGTGSFYSRQEGTFAGFRQGTPEYDRLLSQYLKQVEDHLAKNGWLGREYVYWFDEPDPKDYPFVREGMLNIRKNAPRLTRFITEHRPGPEIMDVSEIGCTIFDRVDPKAVAELAPKGREFWSYLCTGPKSPWVTLFIDHPAVNLRMWLWMTYRWGLKGILVWRADYWNSPTLFPPGTLQNPWADPMSYTVGYGVPYGQVNHWGNGDGRFLYPPNRDPAKDKTKYLCGPIDSVRWEVLREGVEDYEYFVLLEQALKAVKGNAKLKAAAAEAAQLLEFPPSLFTSGREYTKDPLDLLRYREKVAAAIERLGKMKEGRE